jgi:hypothetical protein
MLPTLGRTFLPDQWKNTAAEEKIRPLPNFNIFHGIWAEEKFISAYKSGKRTIFLEFT